MLFISWTEFVKQAESLYRNNPLRCRYIIKYKHTTGVLVIKVTDDRQVIPSLISFKLFFIINSTYNKLFNRHFYLRLTQHVILKKWKNSIKQCLL